MATLRFEKMIGTKLTYVPFTGVRPPDDGFSGGARRGRLRGLGRPDQRDKIRCSDSPPRAVPGFPDVPTLKEQGFDMAEGVDRGIAVPPGTPEP